MMLRLTVAKTSVYKMSFYQPYHSNFGSFMCSVSGPSAKASEEDQERTRRLADAEMHRHHLESLLDQRDREITALREVISWPTTGDITFHFSGLSMVCVIPFIFHTFFI